MQIIVQATPLLYQNITDQVFKSIIKRSFTIPVTELTDDDNGSELKMLYITWVDMSYVT